MPGPTVSSATTDMLTRSLKSAGLIFPFNLLSRSFQGWDVIKNAMMKLLDDKPGYLDQDFSRLTPGCTISAIAQPAQ